MKAFSMILIMKFIGYLVSNILISVFIIYIFHCIWRFILNKFSTKKKKDMVNNQINKYNKLIRDLEESNQENIEKNEFSKEIKESIESDLSEFVDV